MAIGEKAMSDKKLEVIPPESGLPAKQKDGPREPSPHLHRGHGVVASAFSGFQAEMQSRTYSKIASAIRAQTEALEAETDRKRSVLKLLRTTHELEEVPDILALDRAQRSMDRSEAYEEAKHQAELNKRRRHRELAEGDTEGIEAERRKFTAQQGYENQQRLKDRNLRIFERRKEATELDAQVEAERLRTELRGEGQRKEQPGNLAALKAKAEEALIEALADGRDADAERWQRVLDAFEE